MSQIDAKQELAAIDAIARSLARITTGRDYPDQPPPTWAIDHAKVIMRDIRSRGHACVPCEPDSEALKNRVYSIKGHG